MGRRVALLIATYEYRDAGLRRLTAPAHDVEALTAVLGDPRIAGFEVTTLVNEPHHRVGEAIGDFYRDRRRDDLTLLYFTGHGLKDDRGRLHLAMADTRRDSLMFTAISAEQIDQAMEGCGSRRKVLILDCCYSGAYPPGRLAKADDQVHTLQRFQGHGRTVLTASDATQYSFEGDRSSGDAAQSVFTRHLTAGLRDGSADLDGDGDITIDELYSYVYDRVVEDTPQQRPKKQDDVQGRTVIARNVNWDLPGYLRNALNSPIATDRLGALDALARLYRMGNETVRVRARTEIEKLTGDDSRTVSAAATDRLQTLTTADPVIEPAVPPPKPAPEKPPPEKVAPEKARPAKKRPEKTPLKMPRMPARRERLAVAAGALAILAGLLIAAGPITREFTSGVLVSGPSADHPWYAAGIAVAAVAAGLGLLRRATRPLVGPGLLLGVAAASCWGLAFFTGELIRDALLGDPWREPRLELLGHLLLIAAAVLAGLHLHRDRTVRLRLTVPRDRAARAVLLVCALATVGGALALGVQLYELVQLRETYPGLGDLATHTWPYAIAVVLALLVPLMAALAAPARFALALLTGWITGGWAISLTTGTWIRGHPDPGRTWAILFGAALLVLLVAAEVLARRPGGGTVRLTRRLLAATLGVTLIVGCGAVLLVDRLTPASGLLVRLVNRLAVSPRGDRLYATALLRPPFAGRDTGERGELIVIDSKTERPVGEPIALRPSPVGVAVKADDGAYLYVADRDSDAVTVLSTRENATIGDVIGVGDEPSDVAMTRDGGRVYVTNSGSRTMTIIQTSNNGIIGTPVELGDDAGASAVSPDGRWVYTTNGAAEQGPYRLTVMDADNNLPVGQVTLPGRPNSLEPSPDGKRLYIGSDQAGEVNRLWMMDTASRQVSEVAAADAGFADMAVHPDGSRLYAIDLVEGVTVVDLTAKRIVGRPVDVGLAVDVAVSPDGERVYVANASAGTVSVLSTTDLNRVTTIDLAS
ncbi:caspase family protein [Actinoplanes sp. NBC_00393]|uniref:caspase, EACC1-associated type n=1 Tax=Actinoplanes sp. NBC_00393 TaxID=2975953 RepID=UPI002E216440